MAGKKLEFKMTCGDQSWNLKMHDILVDEWCELEELSGMDAGELMTRFLQGGMRARKAMYYLARKKHGDKVEWGSSELNFRLGDFLVEQVTPDEPPKKRTTKQAAADPTVEAVPPSLIK